MKTDQEIDRPASYGNILRQRRIDLGLSLDEVSAQTRIRKVYLEHLDNDRFELLPGDAYVKGFIRNYASCLRIPWQPLVELYSEAVNSEQPSCDIAAPSSNFLSETSRPVSSSVLRWFLIVFILIVLLGGAVVFLPNLNP